LIGKNLKKRRKIKMAEKKVKEEKVTDETAEEDEKTECFQKGLYLEDSPECKICEDQEECATRSKGLTEEKNEKPEKKKVKRVSGVKDVALRLLQDKTLAKKTFGELAEIIREEIPGARTTAACLAWYRNRYKDDDDVTIVERDRGRPKKDQEEEPKPTPKKSGGTQKKKSSSTSASTKKKKKTPPKKTKK